MSSKGNGKNLWRSGAKAIWGALFSQTITIIAYPFIARKYSAGEFGVAAAVTSIATVIGSVSSLRYEQAIPLEESEEDSDNLKALCIFLAIATAMLGTLVLFLKPIQLVLSSNLGEAFQYIWATPVLVFSGGLVSVWQASAVRKHQFAEIGKARVIGAISSSVVMLSAHSFGVLSLLVASIISQLTNGIFVAKKIATKSATKLSIVRLRYVATKYKNFPRYGTQEAILNYLSSELATVSLLIGYGAQSAGFYSLAVRIIAMPASILSSSISQVYFAHTTEALREGSLGHLTGNTQRTLMSIASMPVAIALLTAPEVVTAIFGRDFSGINEIIRPLIILQFVHVVSSTLTPVIGTISKQRTNAVWNFFLLTSRLAVLTISPTLFSFKVTVYAYSVTSGILYVILLVWILRETGANLKSVIYENMRILARLLAIILPVVILNIIQARPGVIFTAKAIAVAVAMYLFAKETKKTFFPKKEIEIAG